jgi:hypothetical protein
MTLAFKAKFVACADAIGGEIMQVSFDTKSEGEDEDERRTPYVLISRNFELPGSATIEWHDGNDYDGGATILSLVLARDRVVIELDRDLDIDVALHISHRRFTELGSYLRRMLDDGVLVAC